VPPPKSPGRDHARAELLTEGGDKLTLALLVLRVLLVDNVDFAVPANDLVVRAALLHAGTNLHGSRVCLFKNTLWSDRQNCLRFHKEPMYYLERPGVFAAVVTYTGTQSGL